MTEPIRPATEPIEEEVPGFFEENKGIIIGGSLAIILAILAIGGYQYYSFGQRDAAQRAFATAGDIESLESVVNQYGGTVVGDNARLKLSALLREDGEMQRANELLQHIIDNSPDYELVGGALFGLASNMEAEGKVDEALSLYQQVPAKYGDSYATPLARLAEARLLAATGQESEARIILEGLADTDEPSPASMQASRLLRLLGGSNEPVEESQETAVE